MLRTLIICVLGLSGFAGRARADFIVTYTASAPTNPGTGNPAASKAVFDLNGNLLTVTLTNTAGPETTHYQNGDALLGLFFGTSAFNMTPGTAIAPETVHTNGTVICSNNCDVSSGWEFANTSAHGASNGIAAAGYNNDFGFSNFSPGAATQLDGVDYGIVPADYPGTHGTQINKEPLEVDSVTFKLTFNSGAPGSAAALEAALGTVTFQYGTSLSEFSDAGTPSISSVPEPISLLLLETVVIGLSVQRRLKQPI